MVRSGCIDSLNFWEALLGASEHTSITDTPKLTATAVRQAKPDKKTRRLYDSGGLYLEISPAGSKWWRLKYRWQGKENAWPWASTPT